MDSSSIEYFMEIASGQTFWNVSENHSISQSSVSKSISRLENELGVKLFNREKRSVRLTPAGKIFMDTIKKIEPLYQEAMVQMSKYSTRKKIKCVVQSLNFLDIELKIKNSLFAEKYPDILLSLVIKGDPDLALAELIEEKADFLIGHRFNDNLKYCDFSLLYPDVLYAIFPKNHPLAKRESVDFMEIYKEHFLIRSPFIIKVLKEICYTLSYSTPPNLTFFDVPSVKLRRDHIISRIAFGEGITLYFKSDISIFNLDNVCVCPITGCPEFPIIISNKKGMKLDSHQKDFKKYLCNVIFEENHQNIIMK